MKFCTKCKRLHNDEEQSCSVCKKSLEEIKEENTPVYLMSAEGFELQRVRTALEDNGVPCDAVIKSKTSSAEAVTGYDTSARDILVPYSAYEKAYDICIGIGAIKDDEADIIEDDSDYSDEKVKSAEEQFEEMSGVKRTTIRVVSAILLLLLFALAIYGTDFLTGLIKGLLG